MKILANRFRGADIAIDLPETVPFPSVDAARPHKLLQRCPVAEATPLVGSEALAGKAGVGTVHVKDERGRMGLGSFKALGAAYVIATDAQNGEAEGRTYVAASAGNHGLSVAAGAAAFGAKSMILLSENVPGDFADRLRAHGAQVIRHGATYEESMAGAVEAAREHGWTLLSDSSWEGYVEIPLVLMEGYLVMMAEIAEQIEEPPTHIFLQAGVGGLAGAMAAMARQIWGDGTVIAVVEPEFAPALYASIEAGRALETQGPVSIMGRLDCKQPSLIALKGLARDADFFLTISEEESEAGDRFCAEQGLASTPSGTAGAAALLASLPHREALGMDEKSRALLFLTEGALQ